MNAPINDIRISRYNDKLSHLKKYYQYTKNWFTENLDFRIEDSEEGHQHLFSIYYAVQLCIEVIIDLSAMIVKDLRQKPLDNYKNLILLKENGVVSNKDVPSLNKLIGLRNRIAHDYNGLIDNLALESYTENNRCVNEFISGVEIWIKKNS